MKRKNVQFEITKTMFRPVQIFRHEKKTTTPSGRFTPRAVKIHLWRTQKSLPGFIRLRMHTQYKPAASNQPSIQQLAHTGGQGTTTQPTTNHVPVAFVEFRDVHSAGQAMQMLQGKYLLSSDRGAIRIEYAKSKMAANEQFHHFPLSQMMPPHGCFQATPTTINGHIAWQS